MSTAQTLPPTGSGVEELPPPPLSPLPSDPPPPYPRRTRHSGRHHDHTHTQTVSVESDDDNEATPFLSHHHGPRQNGPGRPRSNSAVSVAPSLAQTIASIFHIDDDEGDGDCRLPEDAESGMVVQQDPQQTDFAWRRYFRPLTRSVYYQALFHLYVVNFPFALAAFLFAFVLTVTGTTLLVVLPLGVLLCFLNLVGVRAFARGELALQTRFHSPLAYPAPYPPRPIFVRHHDSGHGPEPSFYKNAKALFTDSTSYQALFYFIVVKPCITLVLSLALLMLGLPAIVLVLPAPMAFRAIRKLGVWQANVAVEGLYLVVR
ncbi:hypothetical protein MIND_01416600 [Mycena indigotica]|uniref:Putative sensor domain-containing protein n=1 Tax=Mycena indigotica TaxID=2126181 RepID=A0A8H6RYH0_9AGAR|nr:uncharacterized protein MIND_01416600 [Mycena indigotica]KAF7288998.1 hypothetical protein MIND_01416600 [Mycena indigotica]